MIDLASITREKMILVNEKEIPILEDSLTAGEILERAGFAPSEYTLRTPNSTKSIDDKKSIKIENVMRLDATLKVRKPSTAET